MASVYEAPYGARIYFLPFGAIFVRQTILRNQIYHCDGWHGGIAKAGDTQAQEVQRLLNLARLGQLPHCDAEGLTIPGQQRTKMA
jgi:hypothetical protein